MLVFATSDKGGTGRSVTSSNVMYRLALQGCDVCYLDFDFGSPTAGSIFDIDGALRGTADKDGLHSYLRGSVSIPRAVDVWRESNRYGHRPSGAGRLVLFPGDAGGAEFAHNMEIIERCAAFFSKLRQEYDHVLVDLSAGRAYATEIVLAAMAQPDLRDVPFRWLVFHRWTRQHVLAAANLIDGDKGILDIAEKYDHGRDSVRGALRTVRTAVEDPEGNVVLTLTEPQVAWLQASDQELLQLAATNKVGRMALLGSVPLDPVLQWREQLITDDDVYAKRIANVATVEAFADLATKIIGDEAWENI